MADVNAFFSDYLPAKIAKNPDLAASVNSIFQFDIDGAGSWTLDLTGEGTVAEGNHDAPACTITTDSATFAAVLDNPAKAVQMVMMGKLKVSNLMMAQQLQKILA